MPEAATPQHYVLEMLKTRRGATTSDKRYRIVSRSTGLRFEGHALGNYLVSPTEFTAADGSIAFTLGASRRVAPSRWSLTAPGASELASFKVGRMSRGRTTVNLADGRRLTFGPAESVTRDYLRASVLLDTASHILHDAEHVYASTTAPGPPERSLRRIATSVAGIPKAIYEAIAADDFLPCGHLHVFENPTPGDERLIAALLVLRREVVDRHRAP